MIFCSTTIFTSNPNPIINPVQQKNIAKQHERILFAHVSGVIRARIEAAKRAQAAKEATSTQSRQ